MSCTQISNEPTAQVPDAATVDLKLEVVVVPGVRRRSRQALLRKLGVAAGRRFRRW